MKVKYEVHYGSSEKYERELKEKINKNKNKKIKIKTLCNLRIFTKLKKKEKK